MQKIKLLSFNIQGKKSKREKESIVKVAVLIKYMIENKFNAYGGVPLAPSAALPGAYFPSLRRHGPAFPLCRYAWGSAWGIEQLR